MISTNDIITLEPGELGELEAAKAMQSLINTGIAWKLQGSYGRAAMDGLNTGRNMLGKVARIDHFGTYIPSRFEVKEGTKGSYQLVVNNFGKEYADEIANVE